MDDIDDIKLGPQIIKIVNKICRHLYGDKDITSKMASTIGRKTDILVSLTFLESLSTSELLNLIKQLIVSGELEELKDDNWNYHNDFVNQWPNRLINTLNSRGIVYDYGKSEFLYNNEIIDEKGILKPAVKLLSMSFEDPLYSELVDEINKSVTYNLPNAAYILSRKLIENLVVDALRKRFGGSKEGVNLYYNTAKRRFHDLHILIDNLNSNKNQYISEETEIEKIVELSNKFKDKANSSAHSIFSLAKTEDLIDYHVPDIVKLLQSLIIRT